VPETCIVAIAAGDRLPALVARIGDIDAELLTFSEGDWLPALEAIVTRKPKTIALERLFAASPRGAALINRIKIDKRLNASEIKVFAHDSDAVRIVPRLDASAPQALDQRGTRRAPRVRMNPKATAIVEGKTAALIDLSVIGAQVVSPSALKPNQEVSFALVDKDANLRFKGTVAWTSFEIPPNSGPRYRAGIEFVDADPVDVDAFCERHKAA
jgi:hypothetical protein